MKQFTSRREELNNFLKLKIDPAIKMEWEDHIGFTTLILKGRNITLRFFFYNYAPNEWGILVYKSFVQLIINHDVMETYPWTDVIKGSPSDTVILAVTRVLEYLDKEVSIWLVSDVERGGL